MQEQTKQTTLDEIVRMLEDEIARPRAKVAIVADNGHNCESSVLGTRDGYLCLARDIIKMVAATEHANEVIRGEKTPSLKLVEDRTHFIGWEDRICLMLHDNKDILTYDESQKVFWSSLVTRSVYHLPSLSECGIVGAYILDDHEQLRRKLTEFIPEVTGWESDPDYDPPPLKTGK